MKRRYQYVIQDSYKGEPWIDHEPYDKLEPARRQLAKRLADPIWLDDGNRKWRLVRRCITDTVIS